jgi:hypothetical protein
MICLPVMKALAATLLLTVGLLAPAGAGDYRLENRPEVSFNGGPVHISPYPMGKRAGSVWAADACWRDCTASCNWNMAACIEATDADACRPHLDACDHACQRDCRSRGGPLLGFVDW